METEGIAARLRDVRVGVRPELELSRHVFSGHPAYVVRDPITFHTHRLSPEDYQVFVGINADETLGSTFERLCARGVVEPDQEEDFYRYVISLNQRGLLSLPVSDGATLYARYAKRQEAKRKSWLMSLLFLRVPLVQPDRFLERTLPWVAPLFSRVAFMAWIIGLLAGIVIVSARWDEFHSPLASALTTSNLPLLWCLLVGLKVIHEFGHAYACKRFGVNVPEIGAFFMLFTPCAYVDASASWGLESRWQRVVVALAGMYFESIAAMIALAIWNFSGPGALRDAAHYVIVLSTLVTVGFNANPLMKYDGYYILSDVLGMPNLRNEASGQLRNTLLRVLYGVRRAAVVNGICHRLLLALFGIASSAYKVALLIGIASVIALKLPVVGLIVAGSFVVNTIWKSGRTIVMYLLHSDELADRRAWAITVTVALTIAVAVLLTCVPLRNTIEAHGVVRQRDEIVVRAGVPGFLSESHVRVGEAIDAGAKICRLENVEIVAQHKESIAESQRLEVRWRHELTRDRRLADASRNRWVQAEQRRCVAESDFGALHVTTDCAGRVTDIEPLRHLGRYVRQGDPLATVSAGPWQVRVLLNAEQFADSPPRDGAPVRLRLIGNPGVLHSGRIVRASAAGSPVVQDATLTQIAGGEIAVDTKSMQADEALFEVIIELQDISTSQLRNGMTAIMQFEGQRRAVAKHLYRRGLNLLNKLRVAS